MGLLQALWVGATFNDWHLAALCAAVGMPIWAIMVSAGPALATVVRHRRLSVHRERVAVIAAIMIGVGISFAAQYVANLFSHATVTPYYRGDRGRRFARVQPTALLITLVLVWQFILFFSIGGGIALRAYFREPERWRDAQRERSGRVSPGEKRSGPEVHSLAGASGAALSLQHAGVGAFAHPQDPQRAEATLEALVDHLRATLPKLRAGVGNPHSTLAEQMEVCESYLNVMHVRMGARLAYATDVPAALRSRPFPPLMLISLVENAIKHGIEPSPAGGNISISATIEDRGVTRQLAVSVIDDGVGLKSGISGGVGLENIRAQLAARFGVYGELVMRGRPAGGVVATIRIPCSEAQS